jgi:pimeloyl-ACP methyl ester carboxylesterase
MIPDSLLHVIPDAGHLVIEEQPDQLVNKIRRFLQDEDIT